MHNLTELEIYNFIFQGRQFYNLYPHSDGAIGRGVIFLRCYNVGNKSAYIIYKQTKRQDNTTLLHELSVT